MSSYLGPFLHALSVLGPMEALTGPSALDILILQASFHPRVSVHKPPPHRAAPVCGFCPQARPCVTLLSSQQRPSAQEMNKDVDRWQVLVTPVSRTRM